MSSDELIGNVVQIIAHDLRLRTYCQNVVAATLDQRCLPARRDGAEGVPCMAGDKTQLGGLSRKLSLDAALALRDGAGYQAARRPVKAPLPRVGRPAGSRR